MILNLLGACGLAALNGLAPLNQDNSAVIYSDVDSEGNFKYDIYHDELNELLYFYATEENDAKYNKYKFTGSGGWSYFTSAEDFSMSDLLFEQYEIYDGTQYDFAILTNQYLDNGYYLYFNFVLGKQFKFSRLNISCTFLTGLQADYYFNCEFPYADNWSDMTSYQATNAPLYSEDGVLYNVTEFCPSFSPYALMHGYGENEELIGEFYPMVYGFSFYCVDRQDYYQFIHAPFKCSIYGVNDEEGSYSAGYSAGIDDGFAKGQAIGQQYGYAQGIKYAQEQNSTALTIFQGIINIALIPINFFLACLNFEVFGINIGGAVSALLTVCIVVILCRTIFSGGTGSKE